MALVTRCPNCAMTFRVTPLHLRVRNGKVKCGHCAYIFNGFITLAIVEEPVVPIPASHLPESILAGSPVEDPSLSLVTAVAETVIPEPAPLLLSDAGQQTIGVEEAAHSNQPEAIADGNEIIFPVDFAALGPPDLTGTEEKTIHTGDEVAEPGVSEASVESFPSGMVATPLVDNPVPVSEGIPEESESPVMISESESILRSESSVGSDVDVELAVKDTGKDVGVPVDGAASLTGTGEADIAAGSVSYAFETSPPLPRQRIWGLASLLLFIVLAIQAVYTYRTELTVLVPQTRPLLEGYCALLLCDVPFPKDIESLNIESSELQADETDTPGSATLITLTATIRNHASYTQALPAMELTFTNELDQPLAKRVFLPGQYLEKEVNPDRGIAAGQEMTVRLFIDNTRLNAVGYKLFLFYP